MIENHWLGAVLFSKLQKLKNITFLTESLVENISPKSGHVSLNISSTKTNNKNDRLLNIKQN